MGDREERTAYTPEEQSEIDRILGLLPGESADKTPEEPPHDSPLEDAAMLDDGFDLGPDVVDIDDAPAPPSDEIEDITDIIEMVDEPQPVAPDGMDDISSEEILDAAELPADEALDVGDLGLDEAPAITSPTEIGETPLEDLPVFEEEAPPPAAPPKKPLSSIDELDELTAMEPEAVDLQEVSDDRYVDKAEALQVPDMEAADAMESIDSIESLDMDLGALEEQAAAPSEVHIDKEDDFDIGSLSDISAEELSDIPVAEAEDIPEIDLSDIVPDKMEAEAPALEEDIGIDSSDDFGIDGIPDHLDMEEAPSPSRKAFKAEDIDSEIEPEEMIPGIGRIEEAISTEEIPDIEEELPPEPEKPEKSRVEAEGEDDLSDRDIKRLKKALLLFPPALRKAVKEAILNDLLSPRDSRQLIDMILSGKAEESISRFLEKKLGISIDISEGPVPGRRVLTSRPEYTREGLERQKRLFKATRIGAIAAAVAFAVTFLSYQYIYKPAKAKQLIKQGVALILEQGDSVSKKPKDYEKAEGLFNRVEKEYARNYLPGYNAYGRAYFDRRQYDRALGKFERANKINPVDIDTLNNLGYFYSRVPESTYNRIKKADDKESKLDRAIRYYRYALNRKPGNETALYGIGNAYMGQGKYMEAREYYEKILAKDRKSVVGNSGLLNLYIERDVMPQVMAVHSDIVDKKMLSDLPSPLLAKLAAYYIGKKRTDKVNIRVDFGVQTSKFKDTEDNPFPAARSVLDTLHKKDPRYAQQYVLYAKLSREQGNLKLMKSYAERAIGIEKNYFPALHLLGEYHYLVNEPVKAFTALKKAIKAANSPPDFTREDFYYETENLGNSYFIMGNILYYLYDGVKYRFSDDLEEATVDKENEQMGNYAKAAEYYEEALNQGFKSPELFYNSGRIHYMKKQYEEALNRWLELYEESVESPEVMLAMGNAYYHLNNLEAGRGEYLKLISIFEREAESTKKIFPERSEHIRLFQTLATAYNNLGAIYQRKNDETRSNISYWKAIDYARRIERENEYARVNMGRAFKERTKPMDPILDESIPFSLGVYSKEMR